MAFLLGSRNGERYSDRGRALKQWPECCLNLPDTTTRRGIWTAKMHYSTVCRVLDGLVAARASGSCQPDDMKEILREIPPRRGVLLIPGPATQSAFHVGPGLAPVGPQLGPKWAPDGPDWGPFMNAAWAGVAPGWTRPFPSLGSEKRRSERQASE